MAPTEAFAIERLDEGALDAALALSQEVGWNQVAEDWRVFLRGGSVHGVREGGALVATGATLPYDGFGWVSMVLTTRAARGRGVGTAILRRCIDELQAAGRVPVLDATPQGERIYRPLGFLPVMPLTRWRGAGTGAGAISGSIRQAGTSDLPAMIARDAEAFGARRDTLLASLIERAPGAAFVTNGGDCVLGRAGRTALQIGPLVADSPAAALDLLTAALGATAGPVLIDVPDGRPAIEAHLAAAGFAKERSYLRMAHGRTEPFGNPGLSFAIAGPELG